MYICMYTHILMIIYIRMDTTKAKQQYRQIYFYGAPFCFYFICDFLCTVFFMSLSNGALLALPNPMYMISVAIKLMKFYP